MKSMEEKILDKLDKTLLAVRDSTSPALSEVLLGFEKKLDEQARATREAKMLIETHAELHAVNDKKLDEALVRMEPMLESWETATGFRKFSMSLFLFVIALGGAIGTVWVFIKYLVLEAVRK